MDRYDKLGIVLRIVIAIMPFIINGCPFRDYEQSLLSNKNQIQISSVELLSSSQSFSFWSFCIPSWDVSVYPEVEEQLVSDNRNQQLLFIMKSENDQSVIMFMYVDFVQGLENGVFHSIHINTEQQDNIYNYDFDQRNYEGTWILSMITIEQQQIKFQSSESVNYYNLQERIKNENKVTLIIGGTGIVINKYSLGIFRGRLSKLIQQNIEPNIYFEWIYKNCRVPKLIDEEQIVILIEDVFTFDGNTQLIKEIDQIGNRFDFSGWVKYDFQEASYTTTYLLLRLTIFQNYGDELRLGDELVKITVDLDLQNPQKCGYDVISHMYSTPIFGPVNQNYQSRFKFRDDDSYYYKQLRQWHMVQFNYEQNYGAKVSFKFIASNNIINEQFSDKEALGLFTNTKYYAIIGSDRTILKRLRGQLANVKFRYNYLTNNAELMSLGCHYTCNTCDGPLSTNCLECYKQQYRILSEDLKTCSCSFGYIEQFGECKSYFQIFSSISFLDISIYQTTYICDVGQFFLPTIQQCLSCPQKSQTHILCADCLLYPTTWFLKPVCKQDLIVDGDLGKIAYRKQQRSPLNYDTYLIDYTASLVLLEGVQDYCDIQNNLQNCFKIEQQSHIFQPIHIMCKQDHYFYDNKCQQSISNCIKSEFQSYNCLECDVGYYLYENRCLLCSNFCKKCQFNDGNLECLECPDGYQIKGEDCIKCGYNCQTCQFQSIKNSNVVIMKCLKCINDQKYYLSLNGRDCFENPIKNCLYAFEVSINDKSINSLDYEFNSFISDTKITCGQCQLKHTYNEDTNECQIQLSDECYYSYISITTQYKEICLFGPNMKSYNDPISFLTESTCLNYNCHICLIGQINTKVSYICIQCNNGYYAEKLTGLCIPCPQELNCLICYQQNRISKDNWKNQIRAYYRLVIDDDLQSHSFIDNGLSQNYYDYEILCQFCLQGYQIYNGKCIEICPETCLKCQIINYQNICVQCPSIQGKRSLSLHNNQCIQCPGDCLLCKLRDDNEISDINPLFNNLNFQYYTNQCLSKQKGYFDTDLKMYIDCPSYPCMKEIQINLNLHCSHQQYYKLIESFEREEDLYHFKQSNLLIDDLFSNSSFLQYEQNEFYQMANELVIKSIIIRIFSFTSQTCIINNNKSIKQQFSQNIFSAINVQLQLYGNDNTVFLYDRIISIVNFNKVHIEGIILSPLSVHNLKQLFFLSVFVQTIELKNIRYESNFIQDQSQILIWNSTYVRIDNFHTQNLNLTDILAFIMIDQINSIQIIQISNLKIDNCQFNSLSVFYINSKSSDTLYFMQSNISSIFQFSQLVNQTSGQLLIQNVIIQNSQLTDIANFIGGNQLFSIQVIQVKMYQNNLINSTIFGLKSFFYVNNFNFIENKILNGSAVFNNSDYSSKNLYFNYLKFELNFNDKGSKFIRIKNNQDSNKYLFFNSLILNSNSFDIQSIQPLFDKQDESLIFLEAEIIEINNLTITRSFGIKDIVIQKGISLKLKLVRILQDQQYKIQGLHQYFDCVQKDIESNLYFTSLYLYDLQIIRIYQLLIESVSIINYPIINIQSSIEMITMSKVIELYELNINNNLILITDQLKQASIMQLTSQSEYEITISNSVIKRNVMHQYQQNDLINNALIFNFDCSQCTLKLQNLTIQSNLVTNSSQNIIFLKTKKIIMNNIIFQYNCIFNYNILQSHILWGFVKNQEIFLENLIQIFPIKVQTGNAKLVCQYIEITNVNIFNSVGTGLYISLENHAKCLIQNVEFSSIKSLFLQKDENGGAILFDTIRIVEAQIIIDKVKLNDIYCRQKGGFLYLINNLGNLSIWISNVQIQDVYALQGSVIYTEFSTSSNTSNQISLDNIKINNSYTGLMQFLNQFNNLEDSQELKQLGYQRYLFCIYNTQMIKFSNILAMNLNYESLLQIFNIFELQIIKLIITESIFLNSVIQLISDNSNSQIYISDCQIFKISILAMIPYKTECLIQQINQVPYKSFQCFNNSYERKAPNILPKYNNQVFDINTVCIINMIRAQKGNETTSVISIIPFQSYIKLQELVLQDINCEICDNGLLNILLQEGQSLINIKSLNVQRNKCGKLSCINIIKSIQRNRMLQNIIQYINTQDYQLKILNYICDSNDSYEGTCLRIQDVRSLIKQSNLKYNQAINRGGAILVIGRENIFMEQSIIQNNKANIGGGIFLTEQINQNMTLLGSIVSDNIAEDYGDNIAQIPSQLSIQVDLKNNLPKIKIFQREDLVIEEVKIKEYEVMKNIYSNIIYLPNGQQIWDYKYFDWQQAEYKPYNLHFRIVALDIHGSIIKDLNNTQCWIRGRLLDDKLESEFTNNFTNIDKVDFNINDYNLDQMIIYLDDELNKTLQLQFNCSSIQIPKIGKLNQIISYHQNYYLRMNVKSFPCQMGEIKKPLNNICIPCDPELGQYSLIINAQKCQLKDEISTQEIKSAQLNLREGFWRPYFNTDSISQCINLLKNCNGGWQQGDNSCSIGHIGALCEECDNYDIRGSGQFSTNNKYSCSSCQNNSQNIIIIISISIWTLISIFISVKSTVVLLNQISIQLQMTKLKIIKKSNQSQSAILIKMVTNHLQILSVITTFKINFSIGLTNLFNSIGNPIQTMTYSLDCFLISIFSIDIHYIRLIWQVLMPFIYIFLFLGTYSIIVKSGYIQYRLSVITTTFIYIYIYIQPNLVGGFISLISFRSISSFKWIQANVAYRYDTSQHFIWLLLFCLPGIFLIALLIPTLFYLALYINRSALNQRRIRQLYGYLYNEYKTSAFFWEIVKIVEKELLIIFLSYYEENIIRKGTLILLVLFLYSELNHRFKPYQLHNLNQLDALSAKVCQISIILGFGIYIDEFYSSFQLQIPYFIILAILNFFYLFLLFNHLLKSYWIELQGQFDKIRDKIRELAPWTMKHPFLKKHLENSCQKRKRIENNYKKIKKYLFSYAKPILELKDNINSSSNQIKSKINNQQFRNQEQIKKFTTKLDQINDNYLSRTSMIISSF